MGGGLADACKELVSKTTVQVKISSVYTVISAVYMWTSS